MNSRYEIFETNFMKKLEHTVGYAYQKVPVHRQFDNLSLCTEC